jgi:hypothetical protein
MLLLLVADDSNDDMEAAVSRVSGMETDTPT